MFDTRFSTLRNKLAQPKPCVKSSFGILINGVPHPTLCWDTIRPCVQEMRLRGPHLATEHDPKIQAQHSLTAIMDGQTSKLFSEVALFTRFVRTHSHKLDHTTLTKRFLVLCNLDA